MTSGNFSLFQINNIWLDRETRQRKKLDGIEELANSISRLGLIHPVVIQRDGKLIAGERRYTACRKLGWQSIPVQFVEELDPFQLQLIELEENIKRVDISWDDECRAVAAYHAVQQQQNPEWTATDTAKAIGVDRTLVSKKLLVVDEMQRNNTMVLEAPKLSTAVGIAQRAEQRRKASEEKSLESFIPSVASTPKTPLLNIDFAKWQSKYDGPKFNFIHCDFPYGVGADNHAQGAAKSFGGYKDDFTVYQHLLDILAESMTNVVANSAHLMFWFSMDYYDHTQKTLELMGWTVNPFPLIWFKSDNSGILPDPTRGPRRVYETAFMAHRGDRNIVAPVSNICAFPNTKEIHMSEKPRGMLKHFFRMFIDETSVVLDPTCGSANAVKQADIMGANTVLGLEINKEFYMAATENYNANDA